MTSSNYNIAIGVSALQFSQGAVTNGYNIAIGASALQNAALAQANIAIGYQALLNNSNSNTSVAIGYQALSATTVNANGSVAVGYATLRLMVPSISTLSVPIGGSAYTNGTYTNVTMTLASGLAMTNYPVATITVAGGVVTGVTITGINGQAGTGGDLTTNLTAPAASIGGTGSGFSVLVASFASSVNTAIGMQAGKALIAGYGNTFIGASSGTTITYGNNNTFIGNGAGVNQTIATGNTYIGSGAGNANSTGITNISIGMNAGLSETLSGKLHINASTSAITASLIYGDFTTPTIQINGYLWTNQGAITTQSVTTTLLYAQILTGIINSSSTSAVSLTLPTGTTMDTGLVWTANVLTPAFDWFVINTGSSAGAITIVANTAHTILGNATVAINVSAHFRSVRTAANTWITYRLV